MSGNPAAVRRATEAGRALARQGRLTRYALEDALGVTASTAKRWVARWQGEGVIRPAGSVRVGVRGPAQVVWAAAADWQ